MTHDAPALRRNFGPLRRLCLLFALAVISLTAAFSDSTKSVEAKKPGPRSAKRIKRSDVIIPPELEDLKKNYKVRLVYFVPNDKKVKKHYRERCEAMMRVVADFYRREMARHGHKTRGLDFEFDKKGKLKVHLVKGAHPSVHYQGDPPSVDQLFRSQQQEVMEQTGFIRNRAVLVFSEAGGIAEAAPIPQFYSGFAVVSADALGKELTAATIEDQIKLLLDATPVGKGDEKEPRNKGPQVTNGVLIHELGHVFGMLHDSSHGGNVMYYGYHQLGKMYNKKTAKDAPVRFSAPHAYMAMGTRFFSEKFDEGDRTPPTIEFALAEQPKVGDKTVKFKIKATDEKGLRSLVCLQRGGEWIDAMAGSLKFKGKKSFDQTVTFNCPRPLGPSQGVRYIVNVMDVNGNLSQAVVDSGVAKE